MQTFRAYVEQYYPELDFDFYEKADANTVLFPYNIDFDADDIEQINYLPFNYDSAHGGTDGGGIFAENVTDYIFQNYENAILTKYAAKVKKDESDPVYDLARTNLKRAVFNCMVANRYKWNSIYVALQQEYDILDNVNEIFDETSTRRPDLIQSESRTDEYGKQHTTDTKQYGNINTDNTNEYGARSSTNTHDYADKTTVTNDNIAAVNTTETLKDNAHSDVAVNNIGESWSRDYDIESHEGSIEKTTENYTYPYDNPATAAATDKTVENETRGLHKHDITHESQPQVNTTNNSYGEHTTSTSSNTGAHNDEHTTTEQGHTDVDTSSASGYKDSSSNSTTHGDDTSNTTIDSHTDTSAASRRETGQEETVIERRRHGNIGVTTSGQLLTDYITSHDINLIKTVAEDIAGYIFTGLWEV